MTKQYEPDLEAAKIYCTDGDGEIVLNEYESHIKGQRHAASVLMPEIERLKAVIDDSDHTFIQNTIQLSKLEKALDLAVGSSKILTDAYPTLITGTARKVLLDMIYEIERIRK